MVTANKHIFNRGTLAALPVHDLLLLSCLWACLWRDRSEVNSVRNIS